MNSITWYTENYWEYDEDEYVKETQKAIDEGKLKGITQIFDDILIQNFIEKLIEDDISGCDDCVYYAFGESEKETIVDRVMERLKR